MNQPTETSSTTSATAINDVEEAPQKQKKGCGKIFEWFFRYDKKKWLEDMRKGLGLIASIIATITFQSALNPPGGVLQAGLSDKINLLNCSVPNSSRDLCAGEAILSLSKSEYYTAFLVFNTACFIASLCVCLLLVSGLPLKSRFIMWLLLIGMCIAIVTLMAAYLMGVILVTPDFILDGDRFFNNWFWNLLIGFLVMFVIVSSIQALHFAVWCVKKSKKCFKPCNNNRS